MSVLSDFWNWLKGTTANDNTTIINKAVIDEYMTAHKGTIHELQLCEFVLNTAINIIANTIAMCEFKTYSKWEEKKQSQYYIWNYQPNQNQSANEFIHKLVWMLIYRNECLVVQRINPYTKRSEMVIADSYTHECFAFKEDFFTNVVICADSPDGVLHALNLNKTYFMHEVLFFRLNNRNITGLLQQIVSGYNSLLDAAVKKFYKSGGERGILTIDGSAQSGNYGTKEDGTPKTFAEVYQDLLRNQFKAYFNSDNVVLPLFKGFNYDIKTAEATKKSTSEVKDVVDLTDEIYDKVANALQIPAALLRGDVADVSGITKNLVTFAIKPIADVVQTEINRKLFGEKVMKGTYLKIDTTGILYADVRDIADAVSKMISSGVWNVDDARVYIDMPPLNTEWSQKHFITLNYTGITQNNGDSPTEGGENDEGQE